MLDEFDIDLEANGIEGVEIVAVKEIRRTKDGKRNFAKIVVRDGDAQFTAEVILTLKDLPLHKQRQLLKQDKRSCRKTTASRKERTNTR